MAASVDFYEIFHFLFLSSSVTICGSSLDWLASSAASMVCSTKLE